MENYIRLRTLVLLRKENNMLLNISPLKKYPDFRLLFIGQNISFIGNMISYVAVPYQVYELTKSNFLIGALGLVQLFFIVIFGLIGGTFADRLNRRKVMLTSEIIMIIATLCLLINSLLAKPSIIAIFVLVAIFQSVFGFHSPSMNAIIQKIIPTKDFPAVSALNSLSRSISAIAGPALGGLLISIFSFKAAYLFDLLSFFISFSCLYLMSNVEHERPEKKSVLHDLLLGFRFALSKPELMGTYLIDIVAMLFAFPVALFPAMSEQWGGAKSVGVLYAAMAIGGAFISLFSGWTSKIKFHGRAVVIAASLWALFIFGLGFTHSLFYAVFFLIMAGAADMISGIFRQIIWNNTIPNTMRGRLSGIEMISYTSGPLLGNARAGWVAASTSVTVSLWSGGLMCFICVILTAYFLPKFWRYK